MSIEQEIKGIIDNALASHSQIKEVEDLREKVEELTQQVELLSQARDADMNAIQSSILNIKQGEVFISPATISGEISCSRESLGKELQKAVVETINQQAKFKGSPLWNAINGDRAANWGVKSDNRLMKELKEGDYDKALSLKLSDMEIIRLGNRICAISEQLDSLSDITQAEITRIQQEVGKLQLSFESSISGIKDSLSFIKEDFALIYQ